MSLIDFWLELKLVDVGDYALFLIGDVYYNKLLWAQTE
jgi:hypothetical protein